jgi:hypothetical protein
VAEPISEVMRVVTRLRRLEIDDLTADELSEIVLLTRDCRPLRHKATGLLRRLHGWSLRWMAEVWAVDQATAWRWAGEPAARRPGAQGKNPLDI